MLLDSQSYLRFFQGLIVLLYIPFFTVFLPLSVAPLAVQVICPRCGVDGINQVVLSQLFDVIVVVDRAGMAVVLEENVSDKVVIIVIASINVLENCQDYLLHFRYDL